MSSTAGRQSPFPSISVLAIFGPTASGKSAVAAGDRRADPGRARLGRLDAGLPRAPDPDEPGRRRPPGRHLAARPPGHRRRVPGAGAPGDRRDRRGRPNRRRRRRLRSLVPGRADRRAAAGGRARGRASALGAALRPARRGDRARSAAGPRPACGRPGAPERPQARRASPRALAGRRDAGAGATAALDAPSCACRRSSSASMSRPRPWRARIRARTAAMFEQGVEDEVRAAGDVVPQVLGLDAVRELPRSRRSPSSNEERCASPPTSGSGCAASLASS